MRTRERSERHFRSCDQQRIMWDGSLLAGMAAMLIEKIINTVPAETQPPFRFRNYYECPIDGTKWHDAWMCMCNDRCPTCDSEIEPYFSEDVELTPE
jgi:hypothetical protein